MVSASILNVPMLPILTLSRAIGLTSQTVITNLVLKHGGTYDPEFLWIRNTLFYLLLLDTIPKTVLNGKFHGRIPVERPRLRWKDTMREYSLRLNIRGWRILA
jgi:hypothetical protein